MKSTVQIIISDDVETQQNGIANINKIVNPVLVLGAPLIPTALSFSITVITAGFDFSKMHTIELKVIDKDSKLLFSSGESNVPPLGNDTNNMTFNINMKNVVFEYEGMYSGVFKIDGVEYIQEFSVKKQIPMAF